MSGFSEPSGLNPSHPDKIPTNWGMVVIVALLILCLCSIIISVISLAFPFIQKLTEGSSKKEIEAYLKTIGLYISIFAAGCGMPPLVKTFINKIHRLLGI